MDHDLTKIEEGKAVISLKSLDGAVEKTKKQDKCRTGSISNVKHDLGWISLVVYMAMNP